MNFLTFKEKLFNLTCFSTDQVYAWWPNFDWNNLQFAKPEKLLLDLLYLYPFYDNETEMEELRLDEDYLQEDLDMDLLTAYGKRFQSKVLWRRLNLMHKTYGL